MDDDTSRLFHRVAKKMGWTENGGLDKAEQKLLNAIGKSRHAATSGHRPMAQPDSPLLLTTDDEDDPDKENKVCRAETYRDKAVQSSDDDDFDQFLVERATPKARPPPLKSYSTGKKDSSNIVLVSSDDDDGHFENFLQRVKTPKAEPRKISESGSEDSLKNFIVGDYSSDEDFVETKPSSKVSTAPKKGSTSAAHHPLRRPLSRCDSPVFVSDSEDNDDDNIVVKSTWRTRHSKPKTFPKSNKNSNVPCDQEDTSPSLFLPPLSTLPLLPSHQTTDLSQTSHRRTCSAPSVLDDSASSEDEFTSLLERLKNKLASTSSSPQNITVSRKDPPVSVPPSKDPTTPRSKLPREGPVHATTTLKPMVSQTEPRHGPVSRVALCKTPGCFLQSLSNPGPSYGRNFKHNKEELTSKLYQLYNTSVFDSKLPANMSVTWNKKMRKTAGYCVTGQERGGGSRYARIELSEKVCDSADRLRDTLIHEMCHAATWLINSVRDGHGNFWKLYAHKAKLMHPELPMVTRCHSYNINYKYQYQCSRCQNTIGRHSKSLDTQRFACALCMGRLELLTPSKARAPTPFASFVKEHYGTVRQELAGQSHAEVMRKLSADFASKTKLSQS